MIENLKLPIRLRRRSTLVCVLLLFVAVSGPPAVAQNGTVEGVIAYQADPARPWRYARYYVKQAKAGELAEAVVAIRAKPVAENDRQPQTIVIDQHNFQFTPETVVIRRGDSVKFTNADQATHNVQSSSEIATFNSNMPGGGEQIIRFDRAGGIRQPVTVGCVFHSAMRAYIFVFDHPWYQLTAADGRFRLAEVPPGEYELEITHPAGELRTRKRITIKPGEVTQIDIRLTADDKR
ncbi:MAG TPA: carboxypeptidase regulatory-like domain-containing protein [Pirellulaceae bacterium]|jgi:plastocyanin